ncbi:unnamed protein product, partial [Ectocarpus sp. 12 AP-2014]
MIRSAWLEVIALVVSTTAWGVCMSTATHTTFYELSKSCLQDRLKQRTYGGSSMIVPTVWACIHTNLLTYLSHALFVLHTYVSPLHTLWQQIDELSSSCLCEALSHLTYVCTDFRKSIPGTAMLRSPKTLQSPVVVRPVGDTSRFHLDVVAHRLRCMYTIPVTTQEGSNSPRRLCLGRADLW